MCPTVRPKSCLLEALYPPEHPYHHSVIGSMADLSAARLADVAAFFRTYYVPNNAILCVAGDFQPAQAKAVDREVLRPPAPAARRSAAASRSVPDLSAAKHIKLTDAVSLPRAQLIWPTVPAGHPDEPALDMLAAVLGGLRQGEPAVPRADVRPAARGRGRARRIPPSCWPARSRSSSMPGPAKNSTSWSRSPTPRSSGSRARARPPGSQKAQNERESELIMGLQSVTRKAGCSTSTWRSTAIRSVIGPSWRRSSP